MNKLKSPVCKLNRFISILIFGFLLTSCKYSKFAKEIERKSALINSYEAKGLALAHENQQLKVELSQKDYVIQSLETEIEYLKLNTKGKVGSSKIKGRGASRSQPQRNINLKVSPEIINSELKTTSVSNSNLKYKNNEEVDHVNFDIYKWSPQQLLNLAQSYYEKGNFLESSQYFETLLKHFKKDPIITDDIIFQAGVSAFQTKSKYDLALEFFNDINVNHPNSKLFRKSKLWMALSYYHLGQENDFFNIVEEFRKKYRNTVEWEILSVHYEKLAMKHSK
jgi:hypothetical protein